MKILDRYIAVTVAIGTLVALLLLVGLDMFFSVIAQIDNVGKGSYTMLKMLQYVALTTPGSFYELFPMAALLGSLAGMGMLAANSELIAMRASGVSIWRIVRSVLQAGVAMLTVAVVVGEFVAPMAEQHGQQLRAEATRATSQYVSFLGSAGLWVRDADLFIHAGKVIGNEMLADLKVYEFDADDRLKVATRARQAHYQDGKWVLHDVQQTEFGAESVAVRHRKKLARPSLLTPELLSIVMLQPKDMAARDIGQFVGYLEENGLDTLQYRYAFWGRFMTPLSALVMLFISVPFVFGGLRSASTGQRIFIGVLVGFGFYLASQIFSRMGQVYGLNPLVVTLAPNIIFLMIGIRAVRRL